MAAPYTRTNPFPAKLAVNRSLCGEGSEKDTRHFEIDLTGSGLPAIPPGAGFVTNSPTGTTGVSTAGFLGSFWINYRTGDLDARITSTATGVFTASA